MDLAELFKVVVPLIVLGVWALSFLFHKEAQAPAGRPGGPPRRMLPPELEFDLESMPTGRGRPPGGPGSPGRRPGYPGSSEDLLVIGPGNEPTTLTRPRLGGSGSSGKRTGRARAGSSTSKRPKSETARSLPSGLGDMTPSSPLLKSGEGFTPLQVDLAQAATHDIAPSPSATSATGPRTPADLGIANLLDALRSPQRVRELMIAQIVLGPPVARRRR